MSYVVRYRIEGHEKQFETPPYKTMELALEHLRDIKGYEGVYDAAVTPKVVTKPKAKIGSRFGALDLSDEEKVK
jgi:hypothetical protein